MPIFLQDSFNLNESREVGPLVSDSDEDRPSEDYRWEANVVSNGELGYTFIQQNWNKRNHIYDYFSIKMEKRKQLNPNEQSTSLNFLSQLV